MKETWRNRERRSPGIAFLFVGLLLVAACGSDPVVTESTEPDPAAGKIVGVVEGQGDVGTNEVLGTATDGTLAIIPAVDIGLLWEEIGLELSEIQMKTMGSIVSREVIPTAVLASVGENGQFAADPDDGEYVVCLLGSGDGPWRMRGCGPMTVDGPATWGILTGEGGVDVFERSA